MYEFKLLECHPKMWEAECAKLGGQGWEAFQVDYNNRRVFLRRKVG